MRPFFLLYKGPPAPHQICLLKSNSHYDGCTSFSGFVNRSYWCLECEKGYDVDDAKNHSCRGRKCRSCGRVTCPEYKFGTQPNTLCTRCNREFYGADCLQHHRQNKTCNERKCCPKCCAEYIVIKGKKHRCGFAKCNVCEQFVKVDEHKCFIQPLEKPEQQQGVEGEVCMVTPPSTSSTVVDPFLACPEGQDDADKSKQPPLPPLFVYADYEAMQNAEGEFIPNLLCYSTEEEDEVHVVEGENLTLQFLNALDDLTEVPNDDRERPIIVVFHNLKGFDGLFIIRELYDQQRPVEGQLTVGAKILSFTSGPLRFIDSLCFLPFPLAAFPATFNLTELKKGFFPHLFNTPQNQTYVGRIPDLEYYDPEGCMAKKKTELEQWHTEQVRRNVVFDFKQEMIDYCKSDVVLLKAGCEAFVKVSVVVLGKGNKGVSIVTFN